MKVTTEEMHERHLEAFDGRVGFEPALTTTAPPFSCVWCWWWADVMVDHRTLMVVHLHLIIVNTVGARLEVRTERWKGG